MKLTFEQSGTFEAWYVAQKWCRENGVSYGSTCVSSPVALMRGDFQIAKWKNLTPKERSEVHGTITGDFRNGPLTLELKP